MKSPKIRSYLFLAALVIGAATAGASSGGGPRERLLLDSGWRFHLGDDWGTGYALSKAEEGFGAGSPTYSDASWRLVNLPHDWAIEMPFDPEADGAHGFRAVGEGFPKNSVGWYRRSFDLPASDAGRRIWIEFDGVYRDATVIVNGWFVGHHESGYSGFRYDITDLVTCGGRNVISVKVDASQAEGWFYEGAGIYRHVWLVKTAPLSLAPDGVFVFSRFKDNVPSGPAEIHAQARIDNTQALGADATVTWQILGPAGEPIATMTGTAAVGPASGIALEGAANVDSPRLWSPETPVLYTLVTTVSSGGAVVDRVETPFGIRTVGFDPDRGFLLNGQPYTLKGTSNHQDHAGVGSALPDALQYYRISRLKDMGCNAYRTAHNPPTPELLDACDRLGIIVMDENRQLGSDPHHQALLKELVLRDRNHPSVGIWSLGNEEFSAQETPSGMRVVATMQSIVKGLDPTRPVTCNAAVGNVYKGINEAIEVRGWSYHVGKDMDDYHREHPLQPNVGSEQGSTVGTRGIYADDKVRGYVSAYDDWAPEWAQTAETWVSFFGPRPWMSGGFVWTGFDYRGEPTPYGWPCINSHFGIMDTCGFPKDNFFYYKSQWSPETVLHILPHWNWPGREGQPIDVRAQSNCDEVELFLNGASQGRQAMRKYSEIRWKVPYAPGTLLARGYRGGRQVAEARVETTGEPAAVALSSDRPQIRADGEDAAVFTVSITDGQGRVVPLAGNLVHFELSGPGRILGVGNGDPSCHEADTQVPASASRSLPVDGWRMRKFQDTEKPDMPEEAVSYDDSAWDPVDVNADKGPLASHERSIYRAQVDVSQADLDSEAVELVFARLSGGEGVYVNGTRITGEIDARYPTIYDVKALLHAGRNAIAVPVANWGGDGAGISRGVTLRLQGRPGPVAWSRSAFGGLAEVIVQASRDAGVLTLTASSDGLKPATFALTAKAADPRPYVP
jgi:beta-galactosidase